MGNKDEYDKNSPQMNKFLNENGEIIEGFSGNIVSEANEERAKEYDKNSPQMNKYLNSDGSIIQADFSGGGGVSNFSKTAFFDNVDITNPAIIATFTPTNTGIYTVKASCSTTTANETVKYNVEINGIGGFAKDDPLFPLEKIRATGVGTGVADFPGSIRFDLEAGDVVTIIAENLTGSDTLSGSALLHQIG